jgi:hypothetical protein
MQIYNSNTETKLTMPNLAKEFLDSFLVKKKKKFTSAELEELVRTENYGESPTKHVEIFTKMTNTRPQQREVKLIVFPDESAAAFRQCKESSAFERPSTTMSMKDAVRNSHATFASSGDPSTKYKNSDGVDVVVSDSPSPSPKGKSKKSRGGSYNKRTRRSRSRRGLTRKHSRSAKR